MHSILKPFVGGDKKCMIAWIAYLLRYSIGTHVNNLRTAERTVNRGIIMLEQLYPLYILGYRTLPLRRLKDLYEAKLTHDRLNPELGPSRPEQ